MHLGAGAFGMIDMGFLQDVRRAALLAVSLPLLSACTHGNPDPEVASASSRSGEAHFGGLRGCFTMIELGTNATIEYGGEECGVRTTPASTFKIPNALIALDTGVIDENTVFPWDGKERWNPKWNQDQTLSTAIWYSSVPYFQHVAELVGAERYRAYLPAFQYGNADSSGDVTGFWLNDVLQISPREETRFLAALYEGRLPVAPRAVASVRKILELRGPSVPHVRERYSFVDQIPEGVVLSGKTGGAMPDEGAPIPPNGVVGWFVGAVERDASTYVFACRIRSSDRSKNGREAARIAYEILKDGQFL